MAKKKKQAPVKENQKPLVKSRKLLRKEKRLEKKNRRIEYHVKKAQLSKGGSGPSGTAKPKMPENLKEENISGKKVSKVPNTPDMSDAVQKELKQKEKLQVEMAKQRRAQLLAANKDEDREIKRLEKLLKLDKRKKKNIPKSFYTDNLGPLLEVCDRDYIKKLAETEKTIQDSGSEFEEDFAAVTGKKLVKKKKKGSAEKKDGKSDVSDDDFSGSEDNSDEDNFEDDLSRRKKKGDKHRKITEDVPRKLKSKTNSQTTSQSDTDDDEEEEFSDLDVSDNFDDSDFGLGADDGSGSEEDNGGFSEESEDEDSDEDEDLHEGEESDEGGEESGEDEKLESDDSIDSAVVRKGKEENRKRVHFLEEPSNNKSKKLKTNDQSTKGKNDASNNKKKKEALNEKSSKDTKKSLQKLEDTDDDDVMDDDIDDDDFDDDDFDDDEDEEKKEKDKPPGAFKKNPDGTWEDIYGRLRSSTGDVIEEKAVKYVPPHLRGETSDSKKKELERLRRQMKGLMNRLAENNMASISSQLDEMYMTNSRYNMNNTLTSLTLEALVSPVLTPDRLVMEHCLLIALLHANVGSEVGAHFLQTVVQRFNESLTENAEVEDKTLDNLVHILSHLYNFKIFSAPLIFSILEKVSETLNEKRVDLILLILRTVGSTLRKDDPNALKSLVLRLQSKAAGTPELQKSSRVKFMLEVLLAIKNNNMNKIPNYNPENIEHAKKFLRTLIRRGKYVTELNISLEDLIKADERGRWWIVGSAWTGHLPGENNSSEKDDRLKESEPKANSEYNIELLELARKQRMNTDTRRNIFCILLTAEDYLDAFEKLLHLNLKNQQEQEIIHVLLHCALQEKTFNPYYAHLAQKFCDFDRKYQMKIQYAVWDKLKELSSLQSFQISNLARFLSHLFLEKGLPISVLKVVSFAEIDKTSVRLIRQILLSVLMVEDRNESEAVFLRVAPSPKLRLFREGLRLFIRHFMLRPSNTKFLSEEELAMLEERASMAEKALSAAESELQF